MFSAKSTSRNIFNCSCSLQAVHVCNRRTHNTASSNLESNVKPSQGVEMHCQRLAGSNINVFFHLALRYRVSNGHLSHLKSFFFLQSGHLSHLKSFVLSRILQKLKKKLFLKKETKAKIYSKKFSYVGMFNLVSRII